MSDTFTIADLEKMVEDHEAAAIRVKTIINELLVKAGGQPRYAPSQLAQSGGAFSIRSDQFHGRPLATCVREFLDKRRQAEMGPASTNEIFDALQQGGFEFATKTEQIARVSMYNSINKNPVFYKLPNKRWGLKEWYPNAKHQADEDESDTTNSNITDTKESAASRQPDPPLAKENGKSTTTHADRLMEILSENPQKSWTYPEMMTAYPHMKKSAMRVLIFNLKKQGKVINPSHGLIKANIPAA